MSTTLSSATAAAKAAQAELTAPVAANRTVANDGGKAKADVKADAQPAAAPRAEGKANQASAKPRPEQPAKAEAGKGNATAANQPDPRDLAATAAQAAAQALADAAPVVAPLFSELLNLADVAGADADAAAGAGAVDGADSAGSGSAAAGSVLPAMVNSLLNMPAPTAPAPNTDAGAGAAAVDAISATATLSNSATRLNLSAASVAVNPAASAAESDAAAIAAAAAAATAATAAATAASQGATVQAAPAQSGNAAAATRQFQTDTDSAQPVDGQASADEGAAPILPAIVHAPLKEAWVNGVRIVTRAADSAATPAANAAAPANSASVAATAAGAGDERSFTLGAAGTGSGVGAAGQATANNTSTTGVVTLAGTPEQWQQPLRQALGDRLQLQLQRNAEQAVIRLEPPNMGSIEISIRHSAGALQVNLSASNSEVLRQLNTIGDSVRQDLSNRQFTDVAVTVSSSRAQAQADQGGGRNGQQRPQDDGRTPGRALNEDDSTATFAMTGE